MCRLLVDYRHGVQIQLKRGPGEESVLEVVKACVNTACLRNVALSLPSHSTIRLCVCAFLWPDHHDISS